jgi:hypothetical protein
MGRDHLRVNTLRLIRATGGATISFGSTAISQQILVIPVGLEPTTH